MAYKLEMSLTSLTGTIFQTQLYLNGQALDWEFDGNAWLRKLSVMTGPLDIYLHVTGEDRSTCHFQLQIDGNTVVKKKLEIHGRHAMYHSDAIPLMK